MSLLQTVNGRGLLSARPAAAAANEGYIYSASDASLYRSNGSSWDSIAGGLVDQGAFTYLDGTVAAAPATPAAGKLRVYAKTGKVLAVKDDAGVETVLGAGSGSAAALVLLEEHTASASATLDFTTRNVTGQSGATIQTDFDDYEFRFLDVLPATDATQFLARVSTDGGSTYDSTSGHYGNRNVAAGGGAGMDSPGSSNIYLTFSTPNVKNTANEGIAGRLQYTKPQTGSAYPKFVGHVAYYDGTQTTTMLIGGRYLTGGAAVNAIRFLFNSGNIASGTIRVYGVAK